MIDTSANVVIGKMNEVFLQINAEPHIQYELRDHFTFQVEGAKFMPQYRKRNWNGEIHLFDLRTKRIYIGLLDKIVSFCERRDYTYKFVDNDYYGAPFEINDGISYEGVKDYMSAICSHSPRKYQIEGVYDALKHNRKLLISPTASGKSDPDVYIKDPFPKKIRDKDTMQKYLDADEKLANSSLKIEYYDTMLTYIESILKVVQNRTYQIKNAIEFMRFQSGLG